MSEERKSILNMIASGKISAEEGERLLDSLGKETGLQSNFVPNNRKFIKIEVYAVDDENEKEETKVKINVPLNLARTVLQMNSIKNQISVNANDINIDFDEIIKLIEHDAQGELVNIESGKTRVRIWIE